MLHKLFLLFHKCLVALGLKESKIARDHRHLKNIHDTMIHNHLHGLN